MFRFIAAALVASLFSFAGMPDRVDAASIPTNVRPAVANRDAGAPVQAVRYYRWRSNTGSNGRRPGTGFTPWYMLPKTDPRRYNGPIYYWNK